MAVLFFALLKTFPVRNNNGCCLFLCTSRGEKMSRTESLLVEGNRFSLCALRSIRRFLYSNRCRGANTSDFFVLVVAEVMHDEAGPPNLDETIEQANDEADDEEDVDEVVVVSRDEVEIVEEDEGDRFDDCLLSSLSAADVVARSLGITDVAAANKSDDRESDRAPPLAESTDSVALLVIDDDDNAP